jgi:2-polyprenyl-3-methyl-5-hydroxy-6-metoxy-1,4-benzoquinol methylase
MLLIDRDADVSMSQPGNDLMDEQLESNKHLWNKLTRAHLASDFYDVEGFRAGRNQLLPIEVSEVGDVRGKSLLHLQCHFGLDTLSWARLGAMVTGVDFSDSAIDTARSLAAESALEAQFICSDIYALQRVLDREFDIVFTSYGVLCWLPDLEKWAKIISHYLKSGGIFYIAEFHPLVYIFNRRSDATALRISWSYFSKGEPEKFQGGCDYASDLKHDLISYEWQYSLGKIINSLIGAGLRIQFLHEHPECPCSWFPAMNKDPGHRMWRIEGDPIPLTFSIRAIKSAP